MTIRGDHQIQAGDIVLADFSPVRGTEQDGTRPALVVSHRGMHEFSRRAFVCPITRNTEPWPTRVLLPAGLSAHGAVLVDQLRAIDRSARILRKLGRVPDSILLSVRQRLAALTGIDLTDDRADPSLP
jgi:mRNA interferase MazF